MNLRSIAFILCTLFPLLALAQERDSVIRSSNGWGSGSAIHPFFVQGSDSASFAQDSVSDMMEVSVYARRSEEIVPSQRLSGKRLESLSSFSVADAMRYFSGVQIKDYGGVGGLKTIDIRSMGTNHMGVFYDGIQLGNAQNGLVDLGRFSLDNVEEIACTTDRRRRYSSRHATMVHRARCISAPVARVSRRASPTTSVPR